MQLDISEATLSNTALSEDKTLAGTIDYQVWSIQLQCRTIEHNMVIMHVVHILIEYSQDAALFSQA